MFRIAFFLLFLIACVPVWADGKSPKSEPKIVTTRTIVVSPKERMTNRIIFAYDYSASMGRGKIDQALKAFVEIAKQPIDQMEIGLIAFSHHAYRWGGIPEPKAAKPVPKGWAAMPSDQAVSLATMWLTGFGYGPSTDFKNVIDSLWKEKRNKISLIVISDGFFTDGIPASFKPKKKEAPIDHKLRYFKFLIERLQLKRKKLGLSKVVIHCFGVGNLCKSASGYKTLKYLAELTGGAYINQVQKAKVGPIKFG